MKENTIKQFVNSIILLSRIFTKLDDDFFSRKLYNKIFSLASLYIESDNQQNTYDVAQHYGLLINEIDGIMDFLEDIEYLKLIDNTTPLFMIRKNMLSFKLNIIRISKNIKHKINEESTVEKIILKKTKILPEGSNKNKILGFIKKHPKTRAKDIVDEFSILSGRTVKRNLMELVQDGFIDKKNKERSVLYSIIE